jgi:hypothetical protein
LFSELKTTVEVAIALDLEAGRVRAMYYDYWELKGMYKLAKIYDQIKDYLFSFLRLHKIVNDRGMGEQEIISVLELANSHQIEHLQRKVEYLRNDVEMRRIGIVLLFIVILAIRNPVVVPTFMTVYMCTLVPARYVL